MVKSRRVFPLFGVLVFTEALFTEIDLENPGLGLRCDGIRRYDEDRIADLSREKIVEVPGSQYPVSTLKILNRIWNIIAFQHTN